MKDTKKATVAPASGVGAGTLVLTERGFIPVETVKTEDTVRSHDGKMHDVLGGNKATSQVYNIECLPNAPFAATGDRRLYVSRVYNGKIEPPTWRTPAAMVKKYKSSGLIKDRYYLGFPISTKSETPTWPGIDVWTSGNKFVHRKTVDTSDGNLWYTVGQFLACGVIRKQYKPGKRRLMYNGAILYTKKAATPNTVKKVSKAVNCYVSEGKKKDRVYLMNVELGFFLARFCAGDRKFIPPFVYDLSTTNLKMLVLGFFEAIPENIGNKFLKKYECDNLPLLIGMVMCIHKAYGRQCFIDKTEKGYQLMFNFNKRRSDFAIFTKDYAWYPITSITKGDDVEDIYDLDVDTAKSFVVNGCVNKPK